MIGHPMEHFFSLSTGQVARNARGGHDASAADQMFITADLAKGSSGSPVFYDSGSVVGIDSITQPVYYDQGKQANQQLVFKACVPVHLIRRLLAEGDGTQ